MRFSILSLLIALPLAFAVPQGNHAAAYPPVGFTHHLKTPSARPWTRLRDQVIRAIWRIPGQEAGKQTPCRREASNPPPPSKLLARYGGDVVLRFNTSTAEEVRALSEASNTLLLDVWEFTNDWVDIRLAKDVVPSLLGLLPHSLQHAHTPLMHDLAQTIFESYPAPAFLSSVSEFERGQAFTPALRSSPPDETNIFFRDYQPLSVILPWMRLLSSLFPSHVRMINIGISYEGRDIPALRVGVHPTNSDQPSKPRKTIVISGGAHAREWVSVTTVNYVAYSLITSYGKSKDVNRLLEEFDWVFIPTMNPDGYVYTWEVDRLWRKNRQQTELRFCRGLDLDRSYGFEWDGESTKSNPCSESFAGDNAFEAVESRRLAEWARNESENNNVDFSGFLDLHSYSQQVLYPYSYSCSQFPPSLENLEELALGIAKSIRLTNGVSYGVGSACEGNVALRKNSKEVLPRMETSAGSALDWFYHEMGARYSYQIKLRDEGSYGFLLPRQNIVPTGQEIFKAVVDFGKYLLSNKGMEKFGDGVDLSPGTVKQDTPREDGEEKREEGGEKAQAEEAYINEPELSVDENDAHDGVEWELRRRRRR